MELDIYWTTLLILLPTVVLLISRKVWIKPLLHLHRRWRLVREQETFQTASTEKAGPTAALLSGPEAIATSTPPPSKHAEAAQFCRTFISIYLLVMSSEWLSGPYLYPLLRDDRALPELIVCALYATAYTSAAISALVVGFLADRYGRRRACLAQCVIHSAACLTVMFGGTSLPILFIGRVLAGTGLTLLWTVFESWMVTEWNSRGLEGQEGGGSMSNMFGVMTTANCMTAIVGGILGHCMVSITGSKVWPFGIGIILEGVAAVLMLLTMNENYGITREEREKEDSSAPEITGRGRLGDSRIWALTFVTCCFEGTNFLVIFFWPSVLQDAHNNRILGTEIEDVPYGVVFASFMASMIMGALLFNALSGSKILKIPDTNAAKSPVCLLISAIVVAGASLTCLALLRGEIPQFAIFLVFELANGMYIPSMAYIRGLVVDEKSRTGLYGLMKTPLFIFVILALGITAEDNRSRRFIFASASFCLLLAVVAVVFGFWETLRCPESTAVLEDGATSTDVKRAECKEVPEICVEEVKEPLLQHNVQT